MAAQDLKPSGQKGKFSLACRCNNMVKHRNWTAVATPAILPEKVSRRKSVRGQKKEEEDSEEEDI